MRSTITKAAIVALCPMFVFAQVSINQVIQDTGPIFTYILDTGSPSSSRLASNAIADKMGWRLLAEDDHAHAFTGDTVLLNDRIAVVIRREAAGPEVYALGENGPVYRATIAPAAMPGDETTKLRRLEIVENTTGATEVETEYGTRQGKPLSLTYRLTTGQIQVQVMPKNYVDAILVEGQTHFLVVPDFFADDIVYDARRGNEKSAALPAENFFFHLSGDGSSIITCVWQSTGRTARAVFGGESEKRTIARSEIECSAGKPVWVAFAERSNLWHARSIAEDEQKADVALKWRAPFPAKWRASLVADSEVAQSWNFADARIADYNSPAMGTIVYPSWFTDNTPYIHAPPFESSSPMRAVVYPIDRSQATPLNEFLLVDVMRSTLGVGPCQYILDVEGLDAQTSPTPALVCEYVASKLKKNKSRQDPAAMRERIDAMAGHLEHADARVAAYAALSEKIRSIAGSASLSDNAESREMVRILDELDATIAQLAPARRSPKDAKALADELAGLVGQANWQESFTRVDSELRSIGAAQDRTLAKCRMDLRRLKQYCLSVESNASSSALLAEKIVACINEAFQAKE
ncbi:MAG: hypothetical protein SGI88_13695 [Candidatus Hydrogenedentes bacterium]|nr:hypothetical protein [Candidatus Hydrogenedentota bacterium]